MLRTSRTPSKRPTRWGLRGDGTRTDPALARTQAPGKDRSARPTGNKRWLQLLLANTRTMNRIAAGLLVVADAYVVDHDCANLWW